MAEPQKTEKSPVDRLRERLASLVGEQAAILQSATASSRDMTEDEKVKLREIEQGQAKLEEEIHHYIAAAEAQARLEAPQPSPISSPVVEAKAAARIPQSEPLRHTPITGTDVAATSKTFGFESVGKWLDAVALVKDGIIDRRLTNARAAQTTMANEGGGPEGGWAMPPDFSSGIIEAVAGQASLLGRMKPMQSNSNTYVAPVDESTGWGTAGIQAARTAEGAASAVSTIALGQRTVTLYKATALVNITEELSSDNPACAQHITRIVSRQLQGIVERWLLRGSGAGEPLGILNAAALVSVAAESSGNTSGTLIRQNISKMSGRLIPGFDAEAFWVQSPSAKIAIDDLMLSANGNTGAVYGQGFGGALLGYPRVTSMEAQAVGTAGDLTLVAPSGFMTLVKGGIQSQATIYFAFDQGLTTLRAYIRLGQVPILSGAVVPKLDTATTLSHCVTTATRTG